MRYQYAEIPTDMLPDVINEYFVSISSHMPPLDPTEFSTRTSLGNLPDEYVISELEVFKELSKIKIHKSVGPDTIPHKILKNLADVLAAPVTLIINASLRQGIFP
jgi:hypothetical protein